MRFAVFGDDRFRFLICQVFDSLQGAQVEFHPDTLVVRIDKTIGVASESVHMAIGVRNAARAHSDCHLMKRFGRSVQKSQLLLGLRMFVFGSRLMA